MPSSQRRHLLHELAHLPWWVSLAFAAVTFACLRWLAPALTVSSPFLAELGRAASAHAWIALVFLLPIPMALATAARRRRLFQNQSDLDRLRSMPWQDFEQLVGEAYRSKGYSVVQRGGAGADGGVDLELRSRDKKLVVQCKRWTARVVGVQPVRELYGAMTGEEAHCAIFVTSGRYTPDAVDFARDKPIKLVDGAGLAELLRGIKISSPSGFSGPQTMASPPMSMMCPKCGSVMVRRVAKQGINAGGAFFGCSRFPACRGTRALAGE
jgi:restriction system protein